MSVVDSHEKQCGDTGEVTTEDRSSAIAVLVFPVFMIVGAIIAYQTPETFVGFKPYLNPMLMFIMLAMGLTITLPDLKELARRPWSIALGVVCQFIVMPLSAVAISSILGFDQSLTIGLLLLGSLLGGTASNVLAYLAKGDVALSVAMTSVSTLVSPFATPLIMLLLAEESAEVNASGMMASLLKTGIDSSWFWTHFKVFRSALCRCSTTGIAVAFDCSDWDRDDDRCSWGAC
ncbi:bile acid:sodium symporter family protein [Corynebacterium diphtheriae]|nr:putative sodium-dependent transport membrane protein [Corynebacterium diphtheriae INCA 402]CAB0506046.1 bile acid:sodium symporter family protein [Corynebacterium diphtheriae]CAB0551195.1 bile acid:sodium symporter family protein [Corynebacterium diphtheriae]CAB0564054.1 bile acid:sodium symporter family protein [Corynebacterium diphtheriae]CAB0597539.1 bile acid:sodium symporter family protein [Corynebacterium diphtheriae]